MGFVEQGFLDRSNYSTSDLELYKRVSVPENVVVAAFYRLPVQAFGTHPDSAKALRSMAPIIMVGYLKENHLRVDVEDNSESPVKMTETGEDLVVTMDRNYYRQLQSLIDGQVVANFCENDGKLLAEAFINRNN